MPVQGTHEGTRGFQACIQTPRSLLLPYVPQMGTAHTPPKRASLPRAHLLCVRTPHTLPPSRQWASNQTSQSTETNPCMPIQATQSPLCVRHPAAGRLRILHSPHMHTTITQLSECRPFLHQLRHSPYTHLCDRLTEVCNCCVHLSHGTIRDGTSIRDVAVANP